LNNFSHQILDGEFLNEKFSGVLIASNFMACHYHLGGFVGSLLCMSQGIGISLLSPLLFWLEHDKLEVGMVVLAVNVGLKNTTEISIYYILIYITKFPKFFILSS
jgi:hypothetical protein